MPSQKPILVVLGATGQQGGSVIAHYLSLDSNPYALRAVTRNSTSSAATNLASRGVEVVTGDFDDPRSLEAAFEGATIIFSVTDFVHVMLDSSLRQQAAGSGKTTGAYARDHESQQNRNIIDAAAKVSTLQKFIFSSLPNVSQLSGGKYTHVYFYDSKAMAEEYGRSRYPELWAKTSVFYAGFFLENLIGAGGKEFRPKLDKARATLVAPQMGAVTSTDLPWYSVREDTGALVAALIQAPPGKTLLGISQAMSFEDVSRIIAQTMEKEIKFVEQTPAIYMGDPDFHLARTEMIDFCIEFGYDGSRSGIAVLRPTELDESVRLQPATTWIAKQDWSTLLDTVE